MHWIDWLLVGLPLAIVLVAGLFTQRYVRSVGDFMTANRSAGRYVLSIAGGELQAGAVVFVATFEVFTHSGFAYLWWTSLTFLVAFMLRVTGFVTYRYRETRAMTLAQFFEIRYNKSFRLFTGLLGFFAGILNFGIIPGIGARAMVYFMSLPDTLHFGGFTLPTYVPLMAVLMSATLFVVLSGGIVTIMVINTLEGIISQLFYLIIIFTLLAIFSWSQMHAVLVNQPPGHSLLNPFDTASVQDFNLWAVLMAVVLSIYTVMAWQNAGAYNSAGLTPHEGRMANILTGWRELGKNAVLVLLALCAMTYLHHPDFSAQTAQVHAAVNQIGDRQAREQMTTPIALSMLLPIGAKGMLCAVLLMGIFGGDATHLHSWGSIFVQDFLVPLRKKPFGPKMHLLMLRGSIFCVACFAFVFGIVFHISDYINMWFSVTTGIFTGGAGAAIIGGLYWKKGTAAGAWAGFITGSLLSVGGIAAQQIFAQGGGKFPLNGLQIAFFSCFIAVAVYVIVSWLTCRQDFNLERMLHRGAYAESAPVEVKQEPARKLNRWDRIVGMDGHFNAGDRVITGLLFSWTVFWFLVFVVGTVWNLAAPWPLEAWADYYHVVGLGLPIFFATVTGIWFTWGGIRDLRDLFKRLGREKVNYLDDGTVVGHRNLDEAGPIDGKK
jgi:SSS family solute:Na+ symporter